MSAEETRVAVEGGKYTFILRNNGHVACLRHGEPWIEQFTTGSKALIMLVAELAATRQALFEARKEAK